MRWNANKQTLSFEQEAVQIIRGKARELNDTSDLDPLIERIGDARIVMLGEASHGTHEYYTLRSQISKRLIAEKNFNFIAVEADWPDSYCFNRYIKSYTAEEKAVDVVKKFDRWPTWMWSNWEIAALGEWLRKYNQSMLGQNKIGFYGLDVYSLWESLEAIRKFLQKADPQALAEAEKAFKCFEPYRSDDDGTSYARASTLVPQLCEDEVVNMLKYLQRRTPHYDSDVENNFSIEQNALIAVNAEKYYRAMVNGSAHAWNIRDAHMQETLDRLLDFHGPDSKVIVWEHNSHIGDASATDMADKGMYNLGELARNLYSKQKVILVGFGSYQGSVIAGKGWGKPMECMTVPEAIRGSWEYLLHEAGSSNKLLIMDDFHENLFMENYFGHRAIGVVYDPDFERFGNYVPSILPKRYDAFIYLDRTNALHPLNISSSGHNIPETYPFGV